MGSMFGGSTGTLVMLCGFYFFSQASTNVIHFLVSMTGNALTWTLVPEADLVILKQLMLTNVSVLLVTQVVFAKQVKFLASID